MASLSVLEALEPEAPLVLPASTLTSRALNLLIEVHGHCLLVTDQGRTIGLINLADLQRGLQRERELDGGRGGIGREGADGRVSTLRDCLRSELVWLPGRASLSELEDQLLPGGLRQVPVFDVSGEGKALLPQGVPPGGLPEASLLGLASRDGLARAVARHLQLATSEACATNASATGSA